MSKRRRRSRGHMQSSDGETDNNDHAVVSASGTAGPTEGRHVSDLVNFCRHIWLDRTHFYPFAPAEGVTAKTRYDVCRICGEWQQRDDGVIGNISLPARVSQDYFLAKTRFRTMKEVIDAINDSIPSDQ